MNAKGLTGLCGVLLAIFSCSQDGGENKADKTATQQDVKGLISAVEEMQSNRPQAIVDPAGKKGLGGINAAVPDGWQAAKPSSSMRVAEYHMAGARPQDEKATLAVFAGNMGSVEANVSRWFGQFSPANGSQSGDHGRRWEKQVDGMNVVLVDISGTFAPNMGMNQQAATPPAPNYRMLGAIVDYGPKFFYFKLIGPKDTVALWAPSFEQFIQSIKKDG
ncbi:MAG: hypothetical protein HOA27_25170 [Gemmatimonadetes bacterium]|jgi:hypothetical protein|nr:hypothetical protein [Gemmatimonadota bacterium]MBT7587852.1 hypothetical protein [Gemmatimonadota bacterium]